MSGALVYGLIMRSKLKKIKRISKIDELTGLANYTDFNSFMSSASYNMRLRDNEHCMVLLDLDDFKFYNDNYGYNTGDQILKQFAAYLKNNLREKDLVFRFKQGDEFVLVLQCSVSQCETVLRRLSNRQNLGVIGLPNFSYGISLVEADEIRASLVIAEEALKEAKKCKPPGLNSKQDNRNSKISLN